MINVHEIYEAQMVELLTTAIRLNRKDFTVFFRFSGHVQELEVQYHPGGWKSGQNGKTTGSVYINDSGVEYESDPFSEVTQNLISASENNGAVAAEALRIKEEIERKQYERLRLKFEGEPA